MDHPVATPTKDKAEVIAEVIVEDEAALSPPIRLPSPPKGALQKSGWQFNRIKKSPSKSPERIASLRFVDCCEYSVYILGEHG